LLAQKGNPKPWLFDSIFYEVNIRSFSDSNADGIGDFKGLTSMLEYIKQLGVNCIWLLPFYPSPLRDCGYDITNFCDIHPDYGNINDFLKFVREAHEYGLRVIGDLVLNHTSDQHPWFKESRSESSSPKRDWFVWSNNSKKFGKARIVFNSTERSNWTWDESAEMYYWHRFFSHQPDLNYDNPDVRQEMKNVVKFWLDKGIDGFRCDAVPFLFEREETICENLIETHIFLKEIRKMIDNYYPECILVAESDQRAAELIPYFGEGDEFHMVFNFPLMSKIFIALAQENVHPIVDIINETMNIPENCNWGTFLRNHDELVLDMVEEEERQIMYKAYATDDRAILNLGLRRRLAPLLNNNREKIELLYALLFSIPGSPFIYYGDEIGMGDNIHLNDRDGLRTPMQWSGDTNAGFSQADSDRLFLPVITNPIYHYINVNVSVQQRFDSSLLNTIKKLIAIRKQYRVFSVGSLEFVETDNPKILAIIRKYENEMLIAILNISSMTQPVKINLRQYNTIRPVDLIGKTQFPVFDASRCLFTLPAYKYYWFHIRDPSV
jgi:maltose alpha-D-glucosyltransferase/alpha-amylase